MTITTSFLLLCFLGMFWERHVAVYSKSFAQTYSRCDLSHNQGRWPNTPWIASNFHFLKRWHTLGSFALLPWKNKLRWCYLELLLTLEQNSEPCLKVWGLTKGSSGDHKKKKRDSSFNGNTSSCVFVSFSSEDAHEVRMGYEQMACFITGEHSALMLFFEHEYCSLQVKPKLTSFLPELCPLPAASLLEIPLWRWQYPDSPEQLHFKDLITPFHTLLFYCSGILARFSSILLLQLTSQLWLNYRFERQCFFFLPSLPVYTSASFYH